MTVLGGFLEIRTPLSKPLSDIKDGTPQSPNGNLEKYILVNTNGSFISLTVFVTDIGGGQYRNVINFEYLLDLSSTVDGFQLRKDDMTDAEWEKVQVMDLGGIPLSRSGSQFENYPFADIGSTEPTILSNTSFANIFKNSTKNDADINDWNIANVTDMTSAFEGNTAFNQSLNAWDVGNVMDMTNIFSGATSFNQSLNAWNVGNVTNMSGMFNGAINFNQNCNSWNVSNVTDMSSMFSGDIAFNSPLNSWNVGNVNSMNSMFFENEEFNQPLGSWNTINVVDMGGMFAGDSQFNYPLNLWNVSNVKNMANMFVNANEFNQNLHYWETDNVTSMNRMFEGAGNFNGALVYWDTIKVSDFSDMFKNATAFDQPIELWTVTASFSSEYGKSGTPVALTDMFSGATAMQNNTRYDDLPAGVEGPDSNTPNVAFFNQTTRWCLVAGTMITTDQGEIKIEELTKTNTINGLKVLGLSKNHVNTGEEMVLIEKDAIDENVPVKDLCMSTGHRVQYKGQLVKCADLIGEIEKIKMTKLDENQIIYNVLLEKYTTMKANNMDVETLEMHLKYQPGLIKLF